MDNTIFHAMLSRNFKNYAIIGAKWYFYHSAQKDSHELYSLYMPT